MKKKLRAVHLLITGGTIGSEWSPVSDTAVVTAQDAVSEYIKEYIQPGFEIKQTIITMKDSREVTEFTCEEILDAIQKSKHNNIIVTHGTYTMPDTARFLKKRLEGKIGDKKVILVGSFWPLKGYAPTDAPFNIGFALGSFLGIQAGVYLSMHAQLFDPDEVTKDLEHAHFRLNRASLEQD
ncbi:MAG: asparaginase domain-containing protein [Alphaproteobacteria bacterium]